ncbi:metalloendopeptidase [Trichonephila clavipes]|nr:metalloendopeptidase [Trichonephila clavipes]
MGVVQFQRLFKNRFLGLLLTLEVKAPRGKRVMVTFEDFSFYPRLASRTSKYRGRCVQERVEVRIKSMSEGNMYCGEDIKPGTNLASKGQQFIIIITSNGGMQGTRGLKAKVSFIK